MNNDYRNSESNFWDSHKSSSPIPSPHIMARKDISSSPVHFPISVHGIPTVSPFRNLGQPRCLLFFHSRWHPISGETHLLDAHSICVPCQHPSQVGVISPSSSHPRHSLPSPFSFGPQAFLIDYPRWVPHPHSNIFLHLNTQWASVLTVWHCVGLLAH